MRRKITGVPCKKSEEFPRKKQKKKQKYNRGNKE